MRILPVPVAFCSRHLPGPLVLLGALAMAGPVGAVEGGSGFYILGSRTTTAGVVPPPGVYFQQGLYGYKGSTSGEIARPGRIDANLDASALIGLTTFMWAPATDPVLGGRVYFSGTAVWGYKGIDLDATLAAPGADPISGKRTSETFTTGDPVLGGGIGWGGGPWFGSINVMLNVPIGDYSTDRASNIAFHRWASDITGALTWLDRASGWQADLALGVTFNGENLDTSYHSGNEAHLEAAVARSFASGWSLGVQGYHYEQISDDTGGSAILGGFRGRVSGIGPAVSWSGMMGQQAVSIEGRYFHEFDVRNRLSGDALLLSVTLPLGG